MRQRAAASLLYQSQYAEPAFRNLLNLIFLKIVGRILAFYTNNLLNKHSISEWYWGYHTFEYGFNINLWSRLEIGYVCVILDGKRKANPTERERITFNQDRHFTAKLLLFRDCREMLDFS